MLASLLSLVHRLTYLLYRLALRPRLLPLSQRLHILLMILLHLVLRILKLLVLRLRCHFRCPIPFALRYATCTSIWWTSSRRLWARRRLLHLLALSLRSSLPLLCLLISLSFLRGLRESALLSLRLTPVSRPCLLVAVRNLHFCLLITPIIPSVVTGEASLGSAAPVNPSLLAMFERPLRPSLHLGLTVREAALLEASSRALSESLSHAMWLLSGLLGFVRLQGFSPSDAPLFNTLVTSLSKCLAHQASISASHTAFIGLQRCQFYLSHLPAYFTDVRKRAMMAAPLVCADSLFLESDISRLLSDTQTSSSLRSQQALVDVASNRSGPRRCRCSPARSSSRSSPSRRRRRESGSPSRSSKRVQFDSPAPSSALKPPNKGFRR